MMIFTPLRPMLLHMGKELMNDERWLYEIKWDGWRLLIHKQGERIEAYTRHGNRVTNKFPELEEAKQSITAHTAIIDCEVVVLRNGVSVFEDIAFRGQLTNPKKIEKATITHPVTFIAFDILYTSESHIHTLLLERKERLASILIPSQALLLTPSIEGEGTHLFDWTKERKMEGIVGKRVNSIYQLNHRSNEWLKYKHFKQTDTVILGYKEKPFALIVGQCLKNGTYIPISTVEFGFKPDEKEAFRKIAQGLRLKEERGVTWVEPVLCCSVQYLERTRNRMLRIVSFKGFNFEKNPLDCLFDD